MCPLLVTVPGGDVPAERLREGCQVRANLRQAWEEVNAEASTKAFHHRHRVEIDGIIEPLIAYR